MESQEAKGALTALRNEGEVLNWQSSKERDQFLTVRREVGLDVRHDWRAPASRIRRAQRSTTPRSQASDRLLNQHSPPRFRFSRRCRGLFGRPSTTGPPYWPRHSSSRTSTKLPAARILCYVRPPRPNLFVHERAPRGQALGDHQHPRVTGERSYLQRYHLLADSTRRAISSGTGTECVSRTEHT